MNIPDLLDKLEELEKKATPGEWECELSRVWNYILHRTDSGWRYFDGGFQLRSSEDAQLIVETRNALPTLIKEMRKLLEFKKEALELTDDCSHDQCVVSKLCCNCEFQKKWKSL